MTSNITTAMVLAAGKGSRLQPLTQVLPKPLCEVAGVPLVVLALRQLHAAGIERAVINLHHLGDAVTAALGDQSQGVQLWYSHEETLLGTGGGLAKALPLLGRQPFVVINSDALQDVDLPALFHTHQQSGALATLTLREDPQVMRYGPVGVDAAGHVTRLVDAFDAGTSQRLLMFTGVHVMHPAAVAHLSPSRESCIIRQGYAHHLRRGAHIHSFLHTGAFYDVGTPQSWANAHTAVLGGQESALWHRAVGSHVTAPGIFVDPSAVVEPTARVLPPAVIGAHTLVARHAVVGPYAALGEQVVVEEEARVSHCALMRGARVGQGVVVEHQAWTSGGAVLAWPRAS